MKALSIPHTPSADDLRSGRPCRALVLTNLYPSAERPGHGTFVANQVASLRDRGHAMDVLAFDGSRGRSVYLKTAARLRPRLARGDYDLVHAHYGLTGLVARAQRSVPVLITFLGSDVLWSWQRVLSRAAAHMADFNIVMSAEMGRLLEAPHRCVIPNGTDLHRFVPMPQAEARRALGWETDDFLVLFPSNPARRVKDYPLARAAVTAANERAHPKLRLVDFHGRTQEDFGLALNAADACLVTSRWEGSCNAVREALSVGLPVVAVPVGDNVEMLQGIEWCEICPRDPSNLGAALARLARARRRTRSPLRHDGRARVEAFSLERTARKISRVYAMVLDGERDGPRVQAEVDRC